MSEETERKYKVTASEDGDGQGGQDPPQWVIDAADRGEALTPAQLAERLAELEEAGVSCRLSAMRRNEAEEPLYVVVLNAGSVPTKIFNRVAEKFSEAKAEGKFQQYTLSDVFLIGFTEDGKPARRINLFTGIIDAAIEESLTTEQRKTAAKRREGLRKVKRIRNPISLYFPLDAVSKYMWLIHEALPTKEGEGPGTEIDVTTKKGKKNIRRREPAGIKFAVYNPLGPVILSAFDEIVYIIVGSLFIQGYETITIKQICGFLYDTEPSAEQKRKVWDSLTILACTRIYINNEKELSAGYKYPAVEIKDTSLLVFERESAVTENGEIIEATITIKGEPVLIKFARERRQITKTTPEILRIEASKNEFIFSILEELVTSAAMIKSGTRDSQEILWDTLFRRLGEIERRPENFEKMKAEDKRAFLKKERQRAQGVTRKRKERGKNQAEICLKHMEKIGYIPGYKVTKNRGIKILTQTEVEAQNNEEAREKNAV